MVSNLEISKFEGQAMHANSQWLDLAEGERSRRPEQQCATAVSEVSLLDIYWQSSHGGTHGAKWGGIAVSSRMGQPFALSFWSSQFSAQNMEVVLEFEVLKF